MRVCFGGEEITHFLPLLDVVLQLQLRGAPVRPTRARGGGGFRETFDVCVGSGKSELQS